MNSTLVLEEELHDTSSIELTTVPKYRMRHTPGTFFEDAGTTAATAFVPDTSLYFSYLVTAPRIDLTFVQRQEANRVPVARPFISPLEFESNPIVRVYPPTGKHYPMVVVRRSAASFKPTLIQVFDEEI